MLPLVLNVFFDTDTDTLSFKGVAGTSDKLKGGDVVGSSLFLDLEFCKFNKTTKTNIQGVEVRQYEPLVSDSVTSTPKRKIDTIIQ